jgi:hypothetical protein
MAYLKGIPLNNTSATGGNQDPAQYAAVTQFSNSTWYNRYGLYNPNVTGSLGTTSSGLLYGLGTGQNFDANRIAAGLPINFFQPNPDLREGAASVDRGTGNTRYNAVTFELRRRMSAGLLVAGSYLYSFGRQTYSQNSLREAWYYLPSGGGPIHSLKGNWVYELPFGQGKKWGSGSGRWMNYLIGGWEFDGVIRYGSGTRYNFGGTKFVNMTDKDVQEMFKFYHRADENGIDRIYMWPEDVITNSIIAFNNRSATTASGYSAAGAPPSNGRYFAPASGPDCVQYVVKKDMYCSGTTETRFITGPWFFRTDVSFVKKFTIYKNMRLEARMELFNLFDTVNLIPNTTTSASSVSGWRVTTAATDFSASQDPGGRVTQFGLRFSW